MITSNTQLTHITRRVAKSGHFIAVILIDSETYRIEEQKTELEEARSLCKRQPAGSFVQVYDDQGNALDIHD